MITWFRIFSTFGSVFSLAIAAAAVVLGVKFFGLDELSSAMAAAATVALVAVGFKILSIQSEREVLL